MRYNMQRKTHCYSHLWLCSLNRGGWTISTRISFFFSAHSVHFYHSFVNMCTLSSHHRWGKVKNECKRRTWAPFVAPLLEGTLLLCCWRAHEGEAVKETVSLACLYCGSAQREAAVSWESVLMLFTPHLLLCTCHPDQSEGARIQWGIYGAVR